MVVSSRLHIPCRIARAPAIQQKVRNANAERTLVVELLRKQNNSSKGRLLIKRCLPYYIL